MKISNSLFYYNTHFRYYRLRNIPLPEATGYTDTRNSRISSSTYNNRNNSLVLEQRNTLMAKKQDSFNNDNDNDKSSIIKD